MPTRYLYGNLLIQKFMRAQLSLARIYCTALYHLRLVGHCGIRNCHCPRDHEFTSTTHRVFVG